VCVCVHAHACMQVCVCASVCDCECVCACLCVCMCVQNRKGNRVFASRALVVLSIDLQMAVYLTGYSY